MVVAVTDMAKEVGENPTYKEEDVIHGKNHQQPVEPLLILCSGHEAKTKNVEENTHNCPQKTHPANDSTELTSFPHV